MPTHSATPTRDWRVYAGATGPAVVDLCSVAAVTGRTAVCVVDGARLDVQLAADGASALRRDLGIPDVERV